MKRLNIDFVSSSSSSCSLSTAASAAHIQGDKCGGKRDDQGHRPLLQNHPQDARLGRQHERHIGIFIVRANRMLFYYTSCAQLSTDNTHIGTTCTLFYYRNASAPS